MSTRLPLVLLAPLAIFFGGCESSQRHADAASIAAARKIAEQPTMAGEDSFFEGKLTVEANLGRGFLPRMRKKSWRAGENRYDDMDAYAAEAAREYNEDEEQSYFIPRMRNSTLPPVALRLRVSNNTETPATVEFVECNSSLGNFAVRPAQITIAPGDSAQPDPMLSLLGATQEIRVTVGLRLDGKLETKQLLLTQIPTPPVAAPSPDTAPGSGS